jgi:putative aldouronate transport system permease protein
MKKQSSSGIEYADQVKSINLFPRKKQSFLTLLRTNKTLLLILLPAVIYVILFSYIPMAGIVLAFKSFNYVDGIFGSPWAGLDNFKYLIISDKLWPLTRNTILYNLAFILVGMVFEISAAIFLSELTKKYFKKIAQSAMILPYFISWVVVSSLMMNIFGYEYGVLNGVLRSLGAQPVDIYGNPTTWPLMMIALRLWKTTGYGSVIYLAAIMNIDQEMYEAADIDGASVWRKAFSITLPCLKPTAVILVLLSIGQIFRGDFGMFYQIVKNNQLLLGSSDIIDTFVYRSLINSPDISMSAAAGFYQSVMCFITILIANYAVKKIQPDYRLF